MRLKWILSWSLLLLIVMASSCKSPEESTAQTKAAIQFELKDTPTMRRYAGGGTLHIENTAIVSCSNEVGGTITSLNVTWFVGNSQVASTKHDGGRVSGYGSLEIVFDSECSAIYKPDTVTFRIVGTDGNGYAIDKSLSYSYNWDDANAGFMIGRQ
ncbi:MAG: hypothetical protein PHI34_10235 [Acidobacteriota bacterium]|nr:hypothetical protein [Acidobacteriota bacterium]